MPPLTPASSFVPTSYQEVLRNNYQLAFERSDYQAFVWPYRALGPYLLVLYLLLPPTKNQIVFFLRYPVFAAIVYLSVEAIIQCRSPMVTVGYGIGLLNAFAVLWSATLLVFKDARADFKRIEGHRKQRDAKWKAGIAGQAKGGVIYSDQSNGNATTTSSQESPQNAIMRAGHVDKNNDQKANEKKQAADVDHDEQYIWQRLPSTFEHRLDWVMDLVCSFRGPRWSYQISGMAPPPPRIQTSLADPSLKQPTPESYLTRADLLRYNLPYFLTLLIVLDSLKSLAMQDPYFWSLGPATLSPFPCPRLSRTLLSVTMVFFSLQGIFLLAPLVYGVLLGPVWIGEHSWPWMYTPFYGSLRDISKHGLAGAWGRWWHQLFRFAFEQGGEFTARFLGGEARGWGKKSQRGLILSTVVAFALSGILHACGSYTSIHSTRPLHSFMFFALQPAGLLGQKAMTDWIKRTGWRERIPWWLRELGNFVFVLLWFYITGPIVADDFAATGIWLYEPVPFSIFRGLSGQGWWFGGGTWVRWHTADSWWKSGFAF